MSVRFLPLVLALALLSTAASAQTEQILRPPGTVAYDRVGTDVALDGDRLLIGVPGDDTASPDAGAALVYEYANNAWTHVATLLPPAAAVPQGAGYSVALDGDRAVVGAPYLNGYTGTAYVYDRINGTWTLTATLTASPQVVGQGVGWSVALDGDRIALGIPGDDVGGTDAGGILVFDLVSSTWTQTATLRAASPTAYVTLGYSVDLSGDRVIGGAPVNVTQPGAGAAHVFEKTPLGWTETVLTEPSGQTGDRFGHAVAIDGPLAVVGAYRKTVAAPRDGAVFVFAHNGTSWNQTAQLDGTTPHSYRGFGYDVSTEAGRIVVGAISSNIQVQPGAAFVYDGGSVPALTARLEASDGEQGDLFGIAVAASGPHVVVGANNEATAGDGAGAAYAYTFGSSAPLPFLLADTEIVIGKASGLVGDVHSNGDLTLSRQSGSFAGSYDGDLSAVGTLLIDRNNVVDGDATAGGAISVHSSATVTGTAAGNAAVAAIALPTVPAFAAGTQNQTVQSGQSATLAPGAYRRLLVRGNATLTLTAGTYALDELTISRNGALVFDVSAGPIIVQVASKLQLGSDVTTTVTGTSGPDPLLSDQVTVRSAQSVDLSIGARSSFLGTLVAPDALVRLRSSAAFRGAIAASAIEISGGVSVVEHGAPALALTASVPAPTTSALTAPEAGMVVAPNPVRDAAIVTFALAEGGAVRLAVLDALGREVAILAEGALRAGEHSVRLDAADLPAGVYVLRLTTPTGTSTRRLTRVQ